MDVYIPIATCQTVEKEIIYDLHENPLVDNVWIHPTDEFYPKGDKRRYKAIASNNRDIFQHAIKNGDDFFILCNSNKMIRNIPRLEFIYNYIKEHPRCGFISYSPLKTRRSPHHVCIGFGIVRTEAAKSVNFNFTTQNCNCNCLAQDMRSAGWKVCYEADDIRVKRNSI